MDRRAPASVVTALLAACGGAPTEAPVDAAPDAAARAVEPCPPEVELTTGTTDWASRDRRGEPAFCVQPPVLFSAAVGLPTNVNLVRERIDAVLPAHRFDDFHWAVAPDQPHVGPYATEWQDGLPGAFLAARTTFPLAEVGGAYMLLLAAMVTPIESSPVAPTPDGELAPMLSAELTTRLGWAGSVWRIENGTSSVAVASFEQGSTPFTSAASHAPIVVTMNPIDRPGSYYADLFVEQSDGNGGALGHWTLTVPFTVE